MNILSICKRDGNKDTDKRQTIIIYALFTIWVIQFAFICFANLHWSSHVIDGDMADLYGHVREMWRNKTMFISNWQYATTLELDCASILALPLYGLTKDIFLSFALSNIIILILWNLIVYRLVMNCSKSRISALLSADLLMIPYGVGMLEYFNMLFFNGAQYGIKTLIPLIFLCIITSDTENQDKRNRIEIIIMLVLIGALQFITSLSSGMYVMIAGLVPIILYLIISWMNDHGRYSRQEIRTFSAAALVTVICSILGKIISNHFDVTARGTSTGVTVFNNFLLNFQTVIAGLFEVLSCSPETTTPKVMSFEGVTYICKSFFTLTIIVICIYVQIKYALKRERKYEKMFLLSLLLPWNMFIFIFSDTRYSALNTYMEYRYYLIAYIPVIILAGIMFGRYMEHATLSLSLLIITFVGIMAIGCDKQVSDFRENTDYVYDIKNTLDALPQNTGSVFVMTDNDTARKLRLIDEARTYCGMYYDDIQGVGISDNYMDYTSSSNFSQNNIVLTVTGTNLTDYLSQDVAATYTKIGTIRWFDIYYSDACTFGQ